MIKFNVFFISVVNKEIYLDIPFWTIKLGEEFYPNNSFWFDDNGDIIIKTTDNLEIVNFKIKLIWLKYINFYRNIEFNYQKKYGEDLIINIDGENIDGIDFFNRNVNSYFEKTGLIIGSEIQDCRISDKFNDYYKFIDKTRHYNFTEMNNIESFQKPDLKFELNEFLNFK